MKTHELFEPHLPHVIEPLSNGSDLVCAESSILLRPASRNARDTLCLANHKARSSWDFGSVLLVPPPARCGFLN